ncbi:hypothetical protein pphageT12_54 [Pseudomonas phage pphageT12]|nr:hypothetical protein pphageT12_54 [Pseudomonas phage pphageT12]
MNVGQRPSSFGRYTRSSWTSAVTPSTTSVSN